MTANAKLSYSEAIKQVFAEKSRLREGEDEVAAE
jgi:hypothetical protein